MRCLLGLLLLATLGGARAAEVVNVYNWSDYIAPEVLKQFEKETGIHVVYDVYDSNEMLEAKLLAGRSGYDVVFPTARPFAERQIKAKLYAPLNVKLLPNLKNLDPEILRSLLDIDAGNRFVLPYTWGTTGIGYNKKLLAARLGPNFQADTWKLLFDPATTAKLKDCGIALLDDAEEVLHAALIDLGKDPSSALPVDLEASVKLVSGARPNIRYFHSSQYINDLANGDLCVALGYSGDVLQARDRAAEAKKGVEVAYAVPREGAIMWVDLMAIPANAPHIANAHRFINFILKPDVMAAISNEVAYANANRAATPLLEERIRDDPGVYPSAAVRANLKTAKNLDNKSRRARTTAFQRIKLGR